MKLCAAADITEVLRLYSRTVYRLAYARAGNHSDAEDICQEVFLKLASKNPNFKSEEHRKAWLIKVTVNQAVSLMRTPWRKKVLLKDSVEGMGGELAGDIELSRALASLSENERTLIELYYYEGYSAEEIAEILKRRYGTVRSQLSRARKRLKALLDKEDDV